MTTIRTGAQGALIIEHNADLSTAARYASYEADVLLLESLGLIDAAPRRSFWLVRLVRALVQEVGL